MRGRETYLLCDTVTAPRQTLAELCITARCLQREAGTHITLLWPTLPLGRIAGIGTDSFCLATELLAHSGISTLYTLDAAPVPSDCMLPLHIVSPELSPVLRERLPEFPDAPVLITDRVYHLAGDTALAAALGLEFSRCSRTKQGLLIDCRVEGDVILLLSEQPGTIAEELKKTGARYVAAVVPVLCGALRDTRFLDRLYSFDPRAQSFCECPMIPLDPAGLLSAAIPPSDRCPG